MCIRDRHITVDDALQTGLTKVFNLRRSIYLCPDLVEETFCNLLKKLLPINSNKKIVKIAKEK